MNWRTAYGRFLAGHTIRRHSWPKNVSMTAGYPYVLVSDLTLLDVDAVDWESSAPPITSVVAAAAISACGGAGGAGLSGFQEAPRAYCGSTIYLDRTQLAALVGGSEVVIRQAGVTHQLVPRG